MMYSWNLKTGKIKPVDFPAQESSWDDRLLEVLDEINDWLADPVNTHDAVAAVENILVAKHHDYGEDNLAAFGELGILVRASDKLARLKNLLDKQAEVDDETRADTWRDLAGYAIQALIMLKLAKETAKVDYTEIRQNRLIRGFCPDCGEGVLLRRDTFDLGLACSCGCGFEVADLYRLLLDFPDFQRMIAYLAAQPAVKAQK